MGSFDTIPHRELIQCVARRIVDRDMLHLIKMWLKVPVEERDESGKRRLSGGKKSTCGTPQGGVISPLLANLYMNRFLKYWRITGRGEIFKAQVVNYADDFVICCRGTANEAMRVMRSMMSKLRLTVNETKTRLCRLPEESFDFLGYTIGRCHSPRTGEAYLGPRPSRKSIQRFCREISELTDYIMTVYQSPAVDRDAMPLFDLGQAAEPRSAWSPRARSLKPTGTTSAASASRSTPSRWWVRISWRRRCVRSRACIARVRWCSPAR